MPTFTIPTIYTAVDNYSANVKAMEKATSSFGSKIEAVSNKSEKLFKNLTPGLSDASKQFLQMASSASVVAGVIATARFSATSIMEYETAVQSFRTIVSELNDIDFAKFKDAITDVAKESGKSTTDVATAFENIAGLNAKFAETPAAISAVTSAAITLSKASRDELGVSAENLVGILNQFSLGATEANRTINVLAAGQAVGAASISQTSESFKVFGAVAKQSNLSLEQSVALTEVLASKQIMGAEAGTALRGTLVRLKASGLGYKSGLFDTRDALEEVNQKYNKLKTSKEKDALLDKVFGTINLTTGSILMNNIKLYDKFTKGVTNTTEAKNAAEINSKTLATALDRLKDKWITMITTSEGAGVGLSKVKDIIKLVTDNLDQIVSIGINVIKFFALWKVANIAMKGLMIANNVLLGIQNALRLESTALLGTNTVALTASAIAHDVMAASIAISTGNMAAFNAVMMANPIGATILALALLAGAFYGVNKAIDAFDEPLNKSFERQEQLRQESFNVIELRDKYLALGKTLKEAEKLAVAKASVGVQASIVQAKMQLASLDPEERQKGVEAMNAAANRASQLGNFMNGGFNKDYGQKFANSMDTKSFVASAGQAQQVGQYDYGIDPNKKVFINPKEAQANATASAINNKVEANFTINAPQGTTVTGGNESIRTTLTPQLSSTMTAAR